MMIRKPAVAGRFYPAKPAELQSTLQAYLETSAERSHAIGIIVPHAGYMYSGHVAGAVYSRIEIPSRNIVLCPNHTGYGTPMSTMTSGAWETPLGNVEIDHELCEALIALDPYLQDDIEAHRREHALEVQLPFMQQIAGSVLRFVPITIGTSDLRRLQTLGRAIAEVIRNIAPRTLIIASSDMNHYESDAITRVKDRKAIDQILAMDPVGLYEIVNRENISMCGYGPAVSMLTAAKLLGGSTATLVKYATSGDVSLDFDHVVGYAGIIVE
jgi:AmmeMemoRadiSam system protein B